VEDESNKPKRKRQRKIESSIPKTSAESDLREQSMVSLLELIRADKDEPPAPTTTAQTFVPPPITHAPPPRPQSKPKPNPQRERPNPPKTNTGSESIDTNQKATISELSQKNEQLRLERDNTMQALQSLTQEHEKLKSQMKEAQDRLKQLESQVQQNNTSVASQLPRHSAPNAYQAHQAHQAHQAQHAQQAQQAQQAHQMNQNTNLNSSYPTHNPDRSMNQGYNSHLSATAGGQPDSVLMLPTFAKAPPPHVNRNPLYPNPNQQQPGPTQWGGAPMQYRYQPTAPDNGLWNTQHLASQMR
jgi:FtsZ-binding cell division protein ZapB